MEAIFKFNMDRPQDVVEFNMSTRGREYLEAILTIGVHLRKMMEEGREISDAVEMFSEVTKSIGIHSISNEEDLYDN